MMIEGFFVQGPRHAPHCGGIAHFFPTASVVRGTGEITADNKRIITMDWILRAFPHLDCCSGSDQDCDKQMPQLVDALHRNAHPKPPGTPKLSVPLLDLALRAGRPRCPGGDRSVC